MTGSQKASLKLLSFRGRKLASQAEEPHGSIQKHQFEGQCLRKLKKDSVFLMRLDFTSPGTGKVAVSFTVNFEGV